ncbi:MAG: LysR family transcriptional regulator [Planctomycetota bacterium]|nr:LysR family transcriptional regulator [Planctomycetota bacterium]
MELTPLRYLCAIAETRHMTRAARALGVTQPALSAAIKKLELELGSPLIDRAGRGSELTDAGRVFLRYAEQAVRAARDGAAALREMQGLERGTIRVGGGATATAYLLPAAISAMRQSHPGLTYFIREAGSASVTSALLSGELDLGIVTMPITVPGGDTLVKLVSIRDELRLIAPPEAPDAGHAIRLGGGAASARVGRAPPEKRAGERVGERASLRWRDLAGVPVVGFEAGSAVRDVIDSAAAAAGVTLTYVMELRSIESIKQMVAAGIGVGFVSRFAIADGEGIPIAGSSLTRQLALVRRGDRSPSDATRRFADVMVRQLRALREPR